MEAGGLVDAGSVSDLLSDHIIKEVLLSHLWNWLQVGKPSTRALIYSIGQRVSHDASYNSTNCHFKGSD